MKNDVGNVVSDADGMKNIWMKYIEKLLNIENDWDDEVDYPEVMGPCYLISEEGVAGAIKGFKIGKVSDLINNIVKDGCIPDDWRKSILVHVYEGKVIHL